jgi:hypothetical protein
MLIDFFATIIHQPFPSVSAIIGNTFRQLQTLDQIRGRIVNINQIFYVTVLPAK